MSRKFIITFLITVSSVTAGLLAFVISVDPYDKLGLNLYGFKTKVISQSRDDKFILFDNARSPYGAVIVGSSAVSRFRTATVGELTGEATFNYSVHAGNPDDYVLIVRHIMEKHPPRVILLGLTLNVLNEREPISSELGGSRLRQFATAYQQAHPEKPLFENTYFTLDAIADAFKTFYMNFWKTNAYVYTSAGDVSPKAPTGVVKDWCENFGVDAAGRSVFEEYRLSPRRLDQLREIQASSRDHRTRLVVVLTPLARNCLERLERDPGAVAAITQYKDAVASIFDEVYDLQTDDVKPLSTPENFFDSLHVTDAFADRILRAVFADRLQGLGRRLK